MKEVIEMWKAYRERRAIEMDNLASAVFWIRRMLDNEVTFETVRGSFGWTREEKE